MKTVSRIITSLLIISLSIHCPIQSRDNSYLSAPSIITTLGSAAIGSFIGYKLAKESTQNKISSEISKSNTVTDKIKQFIQKYKTALYTALGATVGLILGGTTNSLIHYNAIHHQENAKKQARAQLEALLQHNEKNLDQELTRHNAAAQTIENAKQDIRKLGKANLDKLDTAANETEINDIKKQLTEQCDQHANNAIMQARNQNEAAQQQAERDRLRLEQEEINRQEQQRIAREQQERARAQRDAQEKQRKAELAQQDQARKTQENALAKKQTDIAEYVNTTFAQEINALKDAGKINAQEQADMIQYLEDKVLKMHENVLEIDLANQDVIKTINDKFTRYVNRINTKIPNPVANNKEEEPNPETVNTQQDKKEEPATPANPGQPNASTTTNQSSLVDDNISLQPDTTEQENAREAELKEAQRKARQQFLDTLAKKDIERKQRKQKAIQDIDSCLEQCKQEWNNSTFSQTDIKKNITKLENAATQFKSIGTDDAQPICDELQKMNLYLKNVLEQEIKVNKQARKAEALGKCTHLILDLTSQITPEELKQIIQEIESLQSEQPEALEQKYDELVKRFSKN